MFDGLANVVDLLYQAQGDEKSRELLKVKHLEYIETVDHLEAKIALTEKEVFH